MALKWKRKTYNRDFGTCQCCGCAEKSKIQIHHIKPKSIFPELIAEETNLITLCFECHLFLHEVVCKGNIYKCNHKALKRLYKMKGTEAGKEAREKCKNRHW